MAADPYAMLQHFTRSTENVLGYLTENVMSVGRWLNIAGNLQKVSASPSGFVWGYNSAKQIFYKPENGTWMRVESKPLDEAEFRDITTDNEFVYVLFAVDGKATITKRSVNGSGDWTTIGLVPNADADSLSSTNDFLWTSGAGTVARCPKPCNNADSWVTGNDKHRLLGASRNTVYAMWPAGNQLVKTDQASPINEDGWTPVRGLSGLGITSVAAEGGDGAGLYVADAAKVYECEGNCSTADNLKQMESQGFVPMPTKGTLTANPSDRTLFMAASSPGTKGNLFQRVDGADANEVMNHIQSVDIERERTFNSLGNTVERADERHENATRRREEIAAFKKAMDLTGNKKQVWDEVSLLRRKIETESGTSNGYDSKLMILYILLLSLLAVIVAYFTIGFFIPTSYLMGLAVLILGVGFGLAIFYGNR
jgi:hypothetical protein